MQTIKDQIKKIETDLEKLNEMLMKKDIIYHDLLIGSVYECLNEVSKVVEIEDDKPNQA